jgi:transposase
LPQLRPAVRLRARRLLVLAQGYSGATIAGMVVCSTRTIARWKTRAETEDLRAVLAPTPQAAAWLALGWQELVA